MTLESAKKNLEARGFRVQVFSSGKEAAAYLDAAVDGTAVGFGVHHLRQCPGGDGGDHQH